MKSGIELPKNDTSQLGLPLEPNLNLSPEEKTRLVNRIREKRAQGIPLSVTEQAYIEKELSTADDNPHKKH